MINSKLSNWSGEQLIIRADCPMLLAVFMSGYFPINIPIPAGRETARLRLEALRPEHVELDYEAVMESRVQLRLWGGTSWPVDSFTRADNLADLQWHWGEHQARQAFTYTVLSPAADRCLGCVYLRPLDELAPANPSRLEDVAPDVSLARFWIRSSLLASDLERHLLDTLIAWFAREWPFSRMFFETRAANGRQAALFDAYPLSRAYRLVMPRRGGEHIFYDATAMQ
ncbi:MAG: GNAT family N-acetyltransferase [Candidatus Promineifilaceae bacterium]